MSKETKIILALSLALCLGAFLVIGVVYRPIELPELGRVVGARTVKPAITPVVNSLSKALAGSVSIKPTSKALRVPVLMYHHVGYLSEENARKKDAVAIDLTVSPADFEEQVKYFKDRGYESVLVKDLFGALSERKSLPAKPVVFTFDDGYKDVFIYAAPILEKYGYKGSFAVSTDLLGKPEYADWSDVEAAHKVGMEIMSHTINHLDLTSSKYSDQDLRREIFDSKKILEEKLGGSVDFLVYPYGKRNQKTEELVKEAGYKMAFTTEYGMDLSDQRLFDEPRVRVHGQNGLEKLRRIFEKIIK